jgi:hypothetical protein
LPIVSGGGCKIWGLVKRTRSKNKSLNLKIRRLKLVSYSGKQEDFLPLSTPLEPQLIAFSQLKTSTKLGYNLKKSNSMVKQENASLK